MEVHYTQAECDAQTIQKRSFDTLEQIVKMIMMILGIDEDKLEDARVRFPSKYGLITPEATEFLKQQFKREFNK